jgi:uncharacterized protein YdeI (YjbR/CyaY-like superfamily)
VKPKYFRDPGELRAWLTEHHERAGELLIGFHKTHTGKASVTWKQVVDEVLCFGWIDGVRRSIDEDRWTIRITPRKPGSIWSAINVRRMGELIERGLVAAAGRRAFDARDDAKTRLYSYEQQRQSALEPAQAKAFRARREAWAYYRAQRPSYQRASTWWVVSAKQEATRARRLSSLIEACAKGEWLPQFRWAKKGK